MKNNHPVVTLLGSNSGNNAGDAAILAGIMDVLSQHNPNTEFFVPTTKPSFVNNHYGAKYNVKGINVMPWTGSIRLFGIPTFNCLRKSDVALICDGIIFDKKLFNPLFNFLITLFFLAPFAKLFNCKLVCYCTGIGPFKTPIGKYMAKTLINSCDLVMMRERDSKKLCDEIGVTQEVFLTGDAAFINQVSDDARTSIVAAAEGIDLSAPLFGINVTSYLDQWLDASERVSSKDDYTKLLCDSLNKAKTRIPGGFIPVLFSTHPMDESFAKEVASKVSGKVISNTKYLSHDLMGIMKRCSLFMGMRFHSLILASAVESPIIGLVYAPKVRSYMRLLECEDVSLELAKLTESTLVDTIVKAWTNRDQIRKRQKLEVDKLKLGARFAASTLSDRYFMPKVELEQVRV
ncbi:MAG: polysaccharide pyruvyl transferase family protein [bacterium]|nr:polysaccharide pyruvyl transferase family protein [bacterium]